MLHCLGYLGLLNIKCLWSGLIVQMRLLRLFDLVHGQANAYWRCPYRPVLTSRQLVEFVVLDVEQVGPSSSSKYVLADVQVCFQSCLLFPRCHLHIPLMPHAFDLLLGWHAIL